MRCLNLGCGSRFHSSWENVDLVPAQAGIRRHDLRRPLPYPNDSFDVVYHAHVLEHFQPDAAAAFLRECYRVLIPGGLLRVVVPDLERIVLGYTAALERARRGDPGWDDNYAWLMLELYDQCVREQAGGRMLAYLSQSRIPNEAFVVERLGDEARRLLDRRAAAPSAPASRPPLTLARAGGYLRDALLRLVLSRADYQALRVGRFRRAGEIHQWMYDSYSLAGLLRQVSFQAPTSRTAVESALPNWMDFALDAGPDGTAHKPDSLYMEALKPLPSDPAAQR